MTFLLSMFSRRLALGSLLLLLTPGLQAAEPINVIFVIGDGMGPTYTTAYRYFSDDPATLAMERSIFDELLVGMAQTYPGDNTLVTDSAAAATALATGVKTRNGAIGVDPHHQPVRTLLEAAKASGYQTAMVATSPITHATPASFAAHIKHRSQYQDIADQYVDQRINGQYKLDLLLGGGREHFARADRDLVQQLLKAGYAYSADWSKRTELKRLPALGLFAAEGMTSALDSEQPLRLRDMSEQALGLLGDKPFFLLIEASQIDWCGHANDIACAMAEMRDLAASLELLKVYVDRHPNTLLVVTADHGTGGLSIGADGVYAWDVAMIRGIKATAKRLAELLLAQPDDWEAVWMQWTGIALSEPERQSLRQWVMRVHNNRDESIPQDLQAAQTGLVAQALAIINQRSHTGWTTTGHTGEDVQIFAYGKGMAAFKGNLDNTDIAQHLFKVFERKI